MALNFNIPMPLSGMDSFAKGFGLTDNLMKQLLSQRELKQKADQFKEELALKKAAAARAGANSDLHRAKLEQEILDLKHKNDPAWKWNQFKSSIGGIDMGEQGSSTQGDQYPDLHKMFSGQGAFPEGELAHGNINLGNRPQVPNPETGGTSTVYSTSFGTPEGEVLAPRVSDDGRILSEEEAQEQYRKTGKHLGIYSSPDEANKAAEFIHQQQAESVGAKPGQHLLDVLRNDPLKRAFFKYLYKVDPLAMEKETPEQKRENDIKDAAVKEQQTIDIKRAQDIKEAAKELQLSGLDIDAIHDILTGPDSLSTGVIKSVIGKVGFGSQKLGELNERAIRLQAQMTHALSSRGGVGAANIVASGKPSSWKGTQENLGITKAYAERIKNEYDLLNNEYKQIMHKDLPYTLPEYVQKINNKINKHINFKPKTKFSSEKEFHDYMKGLKPEERKLTLKVLREASK
jgi:Rod binding domain-containing protein